MWTEIPAYSFLGLTDCIKLGDITIEYCPTEMMLANFITKPLQGAVFHKFRDVIMEWKTIESLKETLETKEHVGSVFSTLDHDVYIFITCRVDKVTIVRISQISRLFHGVLPYTHPKGF